jgi:peptidoglycan/LPS O-acetylase OafA/YrhL
LSGFLITGLLRDELHSSGRLSLPRFYASRAVRLYPTLLLVIATVLAVAPNLWREGILAGLYLSDYSVALFQTPLVLAHTWSLSVEEHFYLLWPLLLPWVIRQADPARVLLRLYVCSLIWLGLSLILLGWNLTYCRFDARLGGLALGCWLALVRLPRMPRYTGWAALALGALLVVIAEYGASNAMVVFMLAQASAVGLIVAAAQGTGPAAVLARLDYVGKLSYGLYLWHWPVFYWLLMKRYDWTITLVVGGALTFILAAASYHMVDVPLQGLKRRLKSGGSAAAATA